MQSSEEEARAAALLEKLLSDDEFRKAFRMDPAGACAAFDLPELVEEFSQGAGQGKALHTLEIRESRSSLAGAFMAAASEGTGAVNHLQNIHDNHHGQTHRVVGKALTAHKLHAVDPNHLHGGGAGVHELVDSSAGGGGSGGGGAVHLADQQSVQSLLHNSHLQLSPEAHAALVRGGADVRLVGVLDELSKDHNLRIGTLHVGHGGAGSFEILSVDGERVSQTNIGARDLANELASLDPSMRPGHIVTPWPIDSDGFSTSGAHENRIQIVFDTPQAGGHAPAVVEQSVAATPAAAAPAAVQVSDTSTAPPEPSTPTTPSTPSTPPAASTTPPEPATTPPPPSTTPPAPSTPPPEPSTASTTPPAPSTTPPAPSTTPPAPSTTPPAPSTTPPAPSTTPPAPVDQQADSTPPPAPADTSTPAPPTTPPAPSTPPAAPPTTPAPPAPDPVATTPPAPTTTPVAPTTAPVEPATPAPAAGPSHQSVVIGAVQDATPADHQTLSFQVSDQHAAGGGGPIDLSAATAFDPNAPGGLPDTGDTYPGDNAPKDQIAAWMGRQAHKAGLPAELPIMAGLTESGLTNVNYGDRDSLGFFQMRTTIWNQGEYAGFPDHPELQLKWFIDHALAVRQERIAQGDANYGQDKSKWGDWVADVEQPAAEYRGRYATHLEEADGLLAQAGASGGTTPGADPLAVADAMGGAAAGGGSTVAVQALMIAEKYKGTPYVWGGASPETGFDCSGLVQYSYKQLGIDLPRVTTEQIQVGVHVPTVDQLKPGDIVFFKDSTGYVHHEGIYIGNHMFLHAPHTGDVIKVSSLDEPYYQQQFAGGSDVSGLAHGAPPPGAEVPQVPAGGVAPPVTPAPAEPAAPATPAPDPGAADAGNSSDGGAADGLFGAIEESQKGGSHSTVQILPAVQDPNETPDG